MLLKKSQSNTWATSSVSPRAKSLRNVAMTVVTLIAFTPSAHAADLFVELGAWTSFTCFGYRSSIPIVDESSSFYLLEGEIGQTIPGIDSIAAFRDQIRAQCEDFFAGRAVEGFPAANLRTITSSSDNRGGSFQVFGRDTCPAATDRKIAVANTAPASISAYSLAINLGPKLHDPKTHPIIFLQNERMQFEMTSAQGIEEIRKRIIAFAETPTFFLSRFKDMGQLVSLMRFLRIPNDYVIRLRDRGTLTRLRKQVAREEELFFNKDPNFACGRKRDQRCGQLSRALKVVTQALLRSRLTREKTLGRDVQLAQFTCLEPKDTDTGLPPNGSTIPGTEVGGGIVTIDKPTSPTIGGTTTTITIDRPSSLDGATAAAGPDITLDHTVPSANPTAFKTPTVDRLPV